MKDQREDLKECKEEYGKCKEEEEEENGLGSGGEEVSVSIFSLYFL